MSDIRKKSNKAAWLVSDCKPYNKRQRYIEELKRYATKVNFQCMLSNKHNDYITPTYTLIVIVFIHFCETDGSLNKYSRHSVIGDPRDEKDCNR